LYSLLGAAAGLAKQAWLNSKYAAALC